MTRQLYVPEHELHNATIEHTEYVAQAVHLYGEGNYFDWHDWQTLWVMFRHEYGPTEFQAKVLTATAEKVERDHG